MKLRIKLAPITEDGEEIYCGGYIDVVKLDLIHGIATTIEEHYSIQEGLYQLVMGKRNLDNWFLYDNRDGRDEQTILQYSIDDGATWIDWKFEQGEER